MTVSKNPYELLHVMKTADIQEIKKEFHRLSKLLHPDTTLLPPKQAEKEFRQICEAYELLSDPIRREAYDRKLSLAQKNMSVEDYESKVKTVQLGSKKKIVNTTNRRPLSGGELFSLLLLCIALCISLLLAIVVALFNGKELQVSPIWLQSYYSHSFAQDNHIKFVHDVKSTTA